MSDEFIVEVGTLDRGKRDPPPCVERDGKIGEDDLRPHGDDGKDERSYFVFCHSFLPWELLLRSHAHGCSPRLLRPHKKYGLINISHALPLFKQNAYVFSWKKRKAFPSAFPSFQKGRAPSMRGPPRALSCLIRRKNRPCLRRRAGR